MLTLNKVLLIRTVPESPKITWRENGTAPCSFTLLGEDPGPDGHTFNLYVPCDVFGAKAEQVAERINGSDTVLVEGKLRWRSRTDKKTGTAGQACGAGLAGGGPGGPGGGCGAVRGR